jgi:hypothetical protein
MFDYFTMERQKLNDRV